MKTPRFCHINARLLWLSLHNLTKYLNFEIDLPYFIIHFLIKKKTTHTHTYLCFISTWSVAMKSDITDDTQFLTVHRRINCHELLSNQMLSHISKCIRIISHRRSSKISYCRCLPNSTDPNQTASEEAV